MTRWLRRGAAGLLVVATLAFGALGLWWHFDQATDDCTAPAWRIAVPVLAGRTVELKVATLLRAAASPLGRRLLDGRQVVTRRGTLRFSRQDGALRIDCAPCELSLPELAAQPLVLAEMHVVLRREGNLLSGTLHSGRLGVAYRATLTESGVLLHWTLPATPVADALAPLRPLVPELSRARLQGRVAAHGVLALPQRHWSIAPRFEGFEVGGLGTERLRYGRFSQLCRSADGALERRPSGDGSPGWLDLAAAGPWLPRAVIAAEDAAFHQHPGYDLAELERAQDGIGGGTPRGASTLSQQLAKNLFTGAEPTLVRKLRELLYVVELERTLGKQRILTLYLNTVDWGPGLCGASAAAAHYFATPPEQLTLGQAAWLAGVLRNPHAAYRNEFLSGRVEAKRLRWVVRNMRLPVTQRRLAGGALAFAQAQDAPARANVQLTGGASAMDTLGGPAIPEE